MSEVRISLKVKAKWVAMQMLKGWDPKGNKARSLGGYDAILRIIGVK